MQTTTSTTATIRVVDTRPEDYLALVADIRAADHEVLYASSGEEALRLPNRNEAGIWLINFDLPDMTGAELFAMLRCRDPELVCVLVSNVYATSDELSARRLGANLYGCKPPQPAWLQAIPMFRRLPDRQHLAHGPPGSPRASPGTISPPVAAPPTQDSYSNSESQTLPTQE